MSALVASPDDNGRSNELMGQFGSGYGDRHVPLTKEQRDLLRFSGRAFGSTIDRDHAINKKFGYNSVDYFRKLEELQDHPGLSKTMKDRLKGMYVSTPGPMTGGAPIYAGNQFTHGTMW